MFALYSLTFYNRNELITMAKYILRLFRRKSYALLGGVFMPKSLIIVESPAKATTIRRFLGKNYIVKASMGHVRDLPRSQFGIDIDRNYKPKYITIRGKGPVLQELRKAAKKTDRVLLATDPDREGEAIAWHLAQALNLDDEKCRIEFREITKQAVKNGVKQPRSISENLFAAQQGRRILDRIVGYKLSPLLWAKVKRGLSAGRVQSVVVRIICDREAEIEAFEPEEYWSATALLTNTEDQEFEAKLFRYQNKKIELHNETEANKVKDNLLGKTWTVSKIVEKERKRNPAPPFITSTLQQEAARKLNFTVKKTMRVAQQLYEGLNVGEGNVGLITYMRTDAVRVANEAVTEVRGLINEKFGTDFLPQKPRVYRSKSGAQEAHEAIRPTSVFRTPEELKTHLNRDQLRLYRLIWERFVASQMASAITHTVTVDITVQDYMFRASGSQIKFPGFIQVYVEGQDDTEKNSRTLPELKENEIVNLKDLNLKQHFTQPPPRYTEAMLVKTLEENGIGRPSTYAPIIDTNLRRGYVFLEDKRFKPTELGIIVVEILKENFAYLLDVDFTASMEQKLDEIEEGKANWVEIIDDFYQEFAKDLKKAHDELEKVEIQDEVSDVECSKCGAFMVIKWGRFGKFLACPNYPECKNTKSLLNEIGVKCPDCADGEIVERRTKRGRLFYGCSNYPDCQFSTWRKPINEKCPKCGQLMVLNKEKHPICINKECSN